MALLVGTTSIFATTLSVVKEKPSYCQFEASATGTVETLELYFREVGSVVVELGIYSDSAGKPATLLGHASGTPLVTKEAWFAVGGFSVSVTKGTKYWLAFVDPLGECKVAPEKASGGSEVLFKNSAAEGFLKSSPTVVAVGARGPISFAALGTEGGKTQKLEATLSFAGALPRASAYQLPASLSFAGALPRNSTHSLTASLTPSAALQRAINHPLAASVSFAGGLPRKVVHGFSAGLSFFGSLTPQEIGKFLHRIEASLGFQGALGRRSTKQLSASLTPQASLQRATNHSLGAGLSFVGALPKVTRHQLAASLSPSGALGRSIRMPIAASLSFVGRLAFKGAKALGIAGRSLPFQRSGTSTPSSRRGRSNPTQREG